MSTARPPKPKAPALAYIPPATLAAGYLATTDKVGIGRMAVAQGDVYGTRNEITIDAVRRFALYGVRAIAVIDDSFDDATMRRMRERGVGGVLARRPAPLGWHIHIYAEGDKLAEIHDR
jgi:2-pyrone-4,6-dicarboxylate lactonase